MSNTKFNAKSFNTEAFTYLVGRVPNTRMSELKKSRALAGNGGIREVFSSQDGAAYARMAMRGLLEGDAVNYDGQTDIPATTTKTFEQGVVAVGRAKAWVEKDFAYDLSGGVDFMDSVAAQIAEYKDSVDEATLLSVLKGIFAMTGAKNLEFVENHTADITQKGDGMMTAVTLNTAANKACGAGKKKFSLVILHSDVATNLENLQLLEHLKYTDKGGITRDLDLGTWNGKLVVVDDAMPKEEIGAAGGNPAYGKYTSYVLGDGAISFEDIGAKVPFEMARDPKAGGGEDTLYMRQRKVFAPFGLSYEKKVQATFSPTDAELGDGRNWAVVNSGELNEAEKTYISHKAIPICRIISKG